MVIDPGMTYAQFMTGKYRKEILDMVGKNYKIDYRLLCKCGERAFGYTLSGRKDEPYRNVQKGIDEFYFSSTDDEDGRKRILQVISEFNHQLLQPINQLAQYRMCQLLGEITARADVINSATEVMLREGLIEVSEVYQKNESYRKCVLYILCASLDQELTKLHLNEQSIKQSQRMRIAEKYVARFLGISHVSMDNLFGQEALEVVKVIISEVTMAYREVKVPVGDIEYFLKFAERKVGV